MITQRGLSLISQLNSCNVQWQLALDCLQGSSIFEQGVAFEVFTGSARDTVVLNGPQDTDIPMLLLEHLLNCIKEDITAEQEESSRGYIHDKGGAFLDLRVPLDPSWNKFNRLLAEEKYFERIAKFLKENSIEYQDQLVTHVLEAWPPSQRPFSQIMTSWKNDADLRRYVEELEEILQRSF